MPTIDPSIVEHRIDTWLDVVPIHQNKRPIHPSKDHAVEAEIEKLRKASFIYPIAYTTWVSNHVPVNKKQGTIYVYTDFHDLKLACPKYNFPNLFIQHINQS